MNRRAFIATVGAVALAPLSARAQQSEPVKRVGALMSTDESDAKEEANLVAFRSRLKELGWIEGRNLRLDIRWGAADEERNRRFAAELVALAPDVILADTSQTVAALLKASRTIPIVFAGATDPVGAGFVDSLARPGGNATGFTVFEYSIAGKWLELLTQIAPHRRRAAVLRDPTIASGVGQFAAIQAVAPDAIELSAINVHDAGTIERALAAFAQRPDGGLIVTASPFGRNHPDIIAALAARYKLPAVYPFRYFVTAGGLISYGPNLAIIYRPAAEYVDRILKGEKPADLPVQAPTKYELVVNLKTAKAIGIEVPGSLLARADEVIE
ncbi:MAG TPA: ABC transporter substrate-binding protein [Stellaceae bacterium]|nr:ABC transporter substrate-binding protein [Stellaceae bacterium]